MAKFKDLKTGDLFIFVAEPGHIYVSRGNNWYGAEHWDGAEHRYDNPDVEIVGHQATRAFDARYGRDRGKHRRQG